MTENRGKLFFTLPGLIAIVFAFFISMQFTAPVFSAEIMKTAASNEELIAVFDFESERGLYKDTAIFLANSIRSELAKGGRYRILERDLMDSLLRKHTFFMTSDLTIEYAVEAGRALKAKTAIIGYVNKKNNTYFLRLSRINIATGAVEFIVEDKCSGGKEALAQLSKTAAAKLFGDAKVVFLRPTKPGNKRFTVSALSIFDTSAKLEWMRDANTAAKTMTWSEANKYIEQLNKNKYAGSGDWRLPEKGEFAAIIEYATHEDVQKNINELYTKIGFKNLMAEYYWSASSSDEMTGLAWVIDLYAGELSTAGKGNSFYVWPVRTPH